MFNLTTTGKIYLATAAVLAAGTMGGCEYSLLMLAVVAVLPIIRYNANKLYQLYSTQRTVGGVS